MTSQSSLVETCRGFVNTWECDENDHYNVQFYFAKKSEADAHFRLHLGLEPSNRPADNTHVRVRQDHVRFHSELRAADTFAIKTGIVDSGEADLTVFHTMTKSNGELAATMVATWEHVDAQSGAPVEWANDMKEKAAHFRVDLPETAVRRSADRRAPYPDVTLEELDDHDTLTVYRGLVLPAECDELGHMTARYHIARSSDGAGHFWNGFGFNSGVLQEQNRGSVVLEYLLTYCWPFEAGDPIEVKSFVRSVGPKTISFSHFLFDRRTGRLNAIADPTAVLFDQTARKAIELSPEERARFEAGIRKI